MKGFRPDKPSAEAHPFVHFICAQARIEGISEREMCRRAGRESKTLTRWKQNKRDITIRAMEDFLGVFDLGLKITRKRDADHGRKAQNPSL